MEMFLEYAFPSVITLIFFTAIYFFLRLYINFNFNPKKETKNMVPFNAAFLFFGLIGLLMILGGMQNLQ